MQEIMRYKSQLNYSEALVQQAVIRFWLRSVGAGFFAAIVLLVSLFIFMLYTSPSGWFVGALGAFLFLAVLFVVLVYVVHYKRSINKFKAMNPKSASLAVSESEFSLSSSLGTVSLTWQAISEVWVYENMWLIFFSKYQFSTIPLSGISEEEQVYFLAQIKLAGGKID